MFAKIENGVTKISPEKQKNAFSILIFGLKLPCFRAGWESLVVRESGDRRDRIFDKKSEKEKTMACIF